MPSERERDLGRMMLVAQVLGVRMSHCVEQLTVSVVNRKVVQELTEHEVTVIAQPWLMLLSVRKDASLDTAVVEAQFVVD